ncbi:MAG: ATP-binding protein [Bdellovibrionales bacterium]
MRRYWLLVFLFVCTTAIWTGLFFLFHDEFERQVEMRSGSAAEEVAVHILDRLESRVKGIQILAMSNRSTLAKNKAAYEENAQILMDRFDGFYAINWVDPSGVIRWVYPREPNKVAENKNLMDRPELVPYLQQSRKDRETRISTRIKTYQGIYATIVYVPVYNEQQFVGWVNAVIDYEALLTKFFQKADRQKYDIQLQWEGDSEPFFTQGNLHNGMLVVNNSYPIFNLKLNIKVGGSVSSELQAAQTYFFILFSGGVVVLLFLFLSLARQLRSEKRLLNANLLLVSKNTLVSALSHDLSTTVMILSNNLRKLQGDGPEKEVAITRLNRALQTLTDLLMAVRNLHVNSLTKEKYELSSVEASAAVSESLELVREMTEKKQINFVQEGVGARVLANPVTLINCVLLNVLKNAIKFSPVGGKVRILTQQMGNEVALMVVDEGVGIESKRLQRLFLTLLSPSTAGTEAESGSGLGLFQVKYFMEAYGGRVEIESDPTQRPGTTVKLWFRLPK